MSLFKPRARGLRSAIDQIEFMRNLLAFLLVGAFISVLPLFSFVVIPDANKDVITYMIGQLSGMATMALGFYFVNKVGQDAIDATRSENTGKMADAITTALTKAGDSNGEIGAAREEGARRAAGAAEEERQSIEEESQP